MRCSVRVLSIALFVFLNFAFFQNSSAQALKTDYQFQNTRSSSVGGAPDLVDLIHPGQSCPTYCNTFTTDTVKGEPRRVLQFPYDNGLELQPTTSVLGNNGVYSVAVLFKFDSQDQWRRVLEFKAGAGDTGLYIRPDNRLSFFGGGVFGPDIILAGTYVQVVLTRDSSKSVNCYLNGVFQFQFTDNTSN